MQHFIKTLVLLSVTEFLCPEYREKLVFSPVEKRVFRQEFMRPIAYPGGEESTILPHPPIVVFLYQNIYVPHFKRAQCNYCV
jgi:hypothetical protein